MFSRSYKDIRSHQMGRILQTDRSAKSNSKTPIFSKSFFNRANQNDQNAELLYENSQPLIKEGVKRATPDVDVIERAQNRRQRVISTSKHSNRIIPPVASSSSKAPVTPPPRANPIAWNTPGGKKIATPEHRRIVRSTQKSRSRKRINPETLDFNSYTTPMEYHHISSVLAYVESHLPIQSRSNAFRKSFKKIYCNNGRDFLTLISREKAEKDLKWIRENKITPDNNGFIRVEDGDKVRIYRVHQSKSGSDLVSASLIPIIGDGILPMRRLAVEQAINEHRKQLLDTGKIESPRCFYERLETIANEEFKEKRNRSPDVQLALKKNLIDRFNDASDVHPSPPLASASAASALASVIMD